MYNNQTLKYKACDEKRPTFEWEEDENLLIIEKDKPSLLLPVNRLLMLLMHENSSQTAC